MAAMDDHDWWSDVQQHRDELADDAPRRRRNVAVWTDEDLELVPAEVLDRPYVSDELAGQRARRAQDTSAARLARTREPEPAPPAEPSTAAAGEPLPERIVDSWFDGPQTTAATGRRFVRTEHEPVATRRRGPAEADVAEPPAPAARRTVRITGDASGATPAVPAARRQAVARRPARSPRETLALRPDRLALYAVMLGFLLIVLAFASSDASAATLAST